MDSERLSWNRGAFKITLAPEAGRLLQVTVEGHDAFWENPDPKDAWNIGGDRIWFAPENDFFWATRGPFDFSLYQVPRDLNENNWACEVTDPGAIMSCDFELQNLHNKETCAFQVSRKISFADETETSISIDTENKLILKKPMGVNQALDMWFLLQVPAGGTLSIPAKAPDYRDYFAPMPQAAWQHDGARLNVEISNRAMFKIGMKAGALAQNKVCYTRPVDAGRRLVIGREFPLADTSDYIDRPLGATDEGDVVQVYSDDGGLGDFGEMEIHTPGIKAGAEELSCTYQTTIALESF